MDANELFENNCFPMFWSEDTEPAENIPTVQKKDLQTLLAELEDIKNKIDDLSAKEWHLSKLMQFHKAGLTTH